MSEGPERSDPLAPEGTLSGTVLRPAELEAEFRARDLRADGRWAAVVIGVSTILWSVFIVNDLRWTVQAGHMPAIVGARLVSIALGILVVVVALRTRVPLRLDLTVLSWTVYAAAFSVAIHASRPRDFYLPATSAGVLVVMAWTLIPNRFVFQAIEAAAFTLATLGWLVAFRDPPPREAAVLIGMTLFTANGAGAYVSWRLHRSRRLEFLRVQEQARIAAHLRRSEALFRTAFENSSIGKALCDMQGRFLRANEAMCRFLGYGADELLALRFADVTHPDDQEASRDLIRRVVAGEPSAAMEKRYLRKDGTVVWGAAAVSLLRDAQGRPLHFIVGVLDVTARRRAEADLSASLSRYAELYESLGDGVVSVDMAGTMLQFNDVYRGMLGYDADELHRMTFAQVTPERWHAEEARVLEETVRARRPLAVYEKEYVRKDGTVFPVEVRAFVRYQDGEPVGMWGIVRDITRERAIRAQLATASRLAALGTLVAGVAHEINNPLGGVLASHGFVAEEIARIRDALRSGEPIDAEATARRMDEVGEALADAQAGEKRIAAIVRDLALLGRPEAARVPVALARVVDDALRWLPRSLADRVDLTVENAGAPEVVAAEGQIAQVVVNLVANAARAIPSSRKGRVRIRTGSAGHGKALVEVTDDGVGMSPEVMRRMFDPFYTTRETGQGMGLGLAISHAIVSAHGGTISASSVPGEGSTFLVELPSA